MPLSNPTRALFACLAGPASYPLPPVMGRLAPTAFLPLPDDAPEERHPANADGDAPEAAGHRGRRRDLRQVAEVGDDQVGPLKDAVERHAAGLEEVDR